MVALTVGKCKPYRCRVVAGLHGGASGNAGPLLRLSAKPQPGLCLASQQTVVPLAVQPDGKILALARDRQNLVHNSILCRFLESGTLDPGFPCWQWMGGYDGQSVALQADGKVLVAGIDDAVSQTFVWRVLCSGAPDPQFPVPLSLSMFPSVPSVDSFAIDGPGR